MFKTANYPEPTNRPDLLDSSFKSLPASTCTGITIAQPLRTTVLRGQSFYIHRNTPSSLPVHHTELCSGCVHLHGVFCHLVCVDGEAKLKLGHCSAPASATKALQLQRNGCLLWPSAGSGRHIILIQLCPVNLSLIHI